MFVSVVRTIVHVIVWSVRPHEQLPWKTITKKGPYEGRTRRSDRAGKTRTALLEKRTTPAPPRSINEMKMENKNKNKSGQMIKCLLTEWGQAGRENIWLSVRMHRPRNSRSVRPDLEQIFFPSGQNHLVNKYIICFKLNVFTREIWHN